MFRGKAEAAAWLAGIIDGEGNIGMRTVKGSRGFVREIRITNTDRLLLDAAESALDLLGITWIEYDRSERERLGTKPIFDIVISRKANLERLAKAITLRGEKAAKFEEMLGTYIRGKKPSQEVLTRLVEQQSDAQIAALYGVTAPAVWFWRRGYGIVRSKA